MKPGIETTEYKVASNAGRWAIASWILGTLVAYGPQLVAAVSDVAGIDSPWGPIAGAAIAILGTIRGLFVELGYIKSRTEVKKAVGPELVE
jgi:hypothetical protein